MAKWTPRLTKVLIAQNWMPEPLELENLIVQDYSARDIHREIILQVQVNMAQFQETVEIMKGRLQELKLLMASTGLGSEVDSATSPDPVSSSVEPAEA